MSIGTDQRVWYSAAYAALAYGTVQSDALTANEWYHVAVTVDAEMKLFINGVHVDTDPTFSYDDVYSWSGDLLIGGVPRLSSGTYFEGSIDEIRVYNRALSEAEVQEIYNRTATNLVEKIVFVSERSGNSDIWMMNPDGTDQIQITNDAGIDSDPMISPDGSTIAFDSNRSGANRIYLMNTDGSNQRTISSDNCYYPSWSPDGSKIYFSNFSTGTGVLSVMNSDGTNVQSLGVPVSRAYVSPDGTKLSYYPPANSNPNSYNVFIVNSDGTNPISLSQIAGLTGFEAPTNAAAWSSAGKILLVAQEPTWLNTTDYDIWWVNADGSASGPLLNESNKNNNAPGWSPDEQKIVFISKRSGNWDIWIMAADGTNLVQLTTNTTNDTSPHWGRIQAVLP